MKRLLFLIGLFGALFAADAMAQSGGTVVPGYWTTTGCPGGNTPCFYPYVSNSGAYSPKTVGVAHAQILAAGVARSYIMLHNPSAPGGNIVYCSFGGAAVVAAAGTASIAPGQYVTWENSFVPNDAIDCIASGANTPLTLGVQ